MRVQLIEGLTYGYVYIDRVFKDLGKNVDIGIYTYINARHGVRIGDNVQIGSHCAIYSEDTERNINCEIIIGEEVKIGSHSVILPKSGMQFFIWDNIKAGSVVF